MQTNVVTESRSVATCGQREPGKGRREELQGGTRTHLGEMTMFPVLFVLMYVCVCQNIKLYTLKGIIYCMSIIPQ